MTTVRVCLSLCLQPVNLCLNDVLLVDWTAVVSRAVFKLALEIRVAASTEKWKELFRDVTFEIESLSLPSLHLSPCHSRPREVAMLDLHFLSLFEGHLSIVTSVPAKVL